jgi:flagellar hook assembly protein FlgD
MPNPVIGRTLIRYAIPRREKVTLKLYNVVGQCVRTLVNEVQTPGVKEKYWDGRDDANRLVPSGVYFYKLEAGKNTATKKLILLR